MYLSISGHASSNIKAISPWQTSLAAVQSKIPLIGAASNILMGIALNSSLPYKQLLDIKVAKRDGFILADASGVVGFNPLNPGQRDPNALRAKDINDIIGE